MDCVSDELGTMIDFQVGAAVQPSDAASCYMAILITIAIHRIRHLELNLLKHPHIPQLETVTPVKIEHFIHILAVCSYQKPLNSILFGNF